MVENAFRVALLFWLWIPLMIPNLALKCGLVSIPETKNLLAGFEKWPRAEWSTEQVHAFAVASGEVSHFNLS
jgi:hypothetical protein